MENMAHSLKDKAKSMGADLFGTANLSPYHDKISAVYPRGFPAFPRSISIGIFLMHAVVDLLASPDDTTTVLSYHHHYLSTNQRLDMLVSRLSSEIQNEGYKALPIPASLTVDKQYQAGLFSHKIAAHLAGLGWIGKNCLLITPQVGPRVRWATILTDAPLETGGEPMQNRCGKCLECMKACPSGAIKGILFSADEPRENRIDVHLCDSYRLSKEKTSGLPVLCGLCVYACPHGKKRLPVGII